MNRTKKLAIAAILTSASVILIWLCAMVPTGSLALVALVGVITGITVIECGYSWALMLYAAVSGLSFLLNPDMGVTFFYIICAGWFPIVKIAVERKIVNGFASLVVKLLLMTVSIAVLYFVTSLIMRELIVSMVTSVQKIFKLFLPLTDIEVYTIIFIALDAVYLMYDRSLGIVLAEYSRKRAVTRGW